MRQTARRNNGASPNGLFFISLNVNGAKVRISFELTDINSQIFLNYLQVSRIIRIFADGAVLIRSAEEALFPIFADENLRNFHF
jgi:hypothetical protein